MGGRTSNWFVIFLFCCVFCGDSQGSAFGREMIDAAHQSPSIRGAVTRKVVLYPHKNKETSQTIERNGLLVLYPQARATIIICHGFMCDMIDAGFLRTLFTQGNYNFLTFNFRAHGSVDNEQNVKKKLDDIETILKKSGHGLSLPVELKNKTQKAQLLQHSPKIQVWMPTAIAIMEKRLRHTYLLLHKQPLKKALTNYVCTSKSSIPIKQNICHAFDYHYNENLQSVDEIL